MVLTTGKKRKYKFVKKQNKINKNNLILIW